MLTISREQRLHSKDGYAFSCVLKDRASWRIVGKERHTVSATSEHRNELLPRCREALLSNLKNLKRLSHLEAALAKSSTPISQESSQASPIPVANVPSSLEKPPVEGGVETLSQPIKESVEVSVQLTALPRADEASEPVSQQKLETRITDHDMAVWNQLCMETRQKKLDLTLTCLSVFRPVIIGLRSKEDVEAKQPRCLALKLEDTFIPPIEGVKRTNKWDYFVSSAGNRCVYDPACTKVDHQPFRDASEDLLTTIDKSSSNLDLANGLFMFSLLMTSLQRIYGNRTLCRYSYKASHSSIQIPNSRASQFMTPCTIPILNNPYKVILWDARLCDAWNLPRSQSSKSLVCTLDSATALSVIGCNSESQNSHGLGGGQLLPAHHYVSGMAAAVPLSIFSSSSATENLDKSKQQRKPRFSFKPAEFTASLRRYLRRRPLLGFSPLHIWWDKAFPVQSKAVPTKPANHCRLSFPVRLILESAEGSEEAVVMYHRLVCVESRNVFGQQSDFASGTFVSLVTANRVRRQLTIHNEGFRNVLMSAYQVHAAYYELLGLEGGARDINSCPYQAIAEILALQNFESR